MDFLVIFTQLSYTPCMKLRICYLFLFWDFEKGDALVILGCMAMFQNGLIAFNLVFLFYLFTLC